MKWKSLSFSLIWLVICIVIITNKLHPKMIYKIHLSTPVIHLHSAYILRIALSNCFFYALLLLLFILLFKLLILSSLLPSSIIHNCTNNCSFLIVRMQFITNEKWIFIGLLLINCTKTRKMRTSSVLSQTLARFKMFFFSFFFIDWTEYYLVIALRKNNNKNILNDLWYARLI